jgi:hypothetical protein
MSYSSFDPPGFFAIMVTIAHPGAIGSNHALATGIGHPFAAPLPPSAPSRGASGPHHQLITEGEIFMRRVTTLAAAVAIAASSAAVARPMHQMHQESGYYVIRWDNTGVCQIWNTELQQEPVRFLSDYKVVSKPVPTFTQAAAIQENMRMSRHCTL